MRVTRYDDPAAFYDRAAEFLLRQEAANCLIIGNTTTLMARLDAYGPHPPYGLVAEDAAGVVVGAALRTPPRSLVLSAMAAPEPAEALADAVAADMPDLPGVRGPATGAHIFAERFARATGTNQAIDQHLLIYQCAAVLMPTGVPGGLRAAARDDVDLLVQYMQSFDVEAMGLPDQPSEARRRWVADVFGADVGLRTLDLWEDDGPVAVVGTGGPTPNGRRVGPVYTPPEKRGRGYASAATAAVTQRILNNDKARAFLFTDSANPTSNKIYQQIGYRLVMPFDELVFTSAG